MTETLPILLVPGLQCSARLYADQIPALWPFGPVTVVDHTRAESMDAIAAQILANAPPRFALVGLSMGGYIAYAILRAAPQRVARLALLDTSARPETPQQTERRQVHIAMAREGKVREIAEMHYPMLVHANRRDDAELRRIVIAMAEETGAQAFIRQQSAIMTRPDSRPDLPKITCPTLVLVGDGDQLTVPKIAEEIAGLIPGSRLVVVPDCGHLSTIERPAAVNAALVEWMR